VLGEVEGCPVAEEEIAIQGLVEVRARVMVVEVAEVKVNIENRSNKNHALYIIY